MRLIDADSITEHEIVSYLGIDNVSLLSKIKEMINDQPTVYDVDKVVEEMKANAKKMSEAKVNMEPDKSAHIYYKAIGTRKCEEIIRNGGFIC